MSEEKLTLKERIKLEKARRAEAKTIEEAQFSIDHKEIAQESEEASTLVCQITKEDGAYFEVVKLAESMGMELKKINEEGDHAYSYKQYVMFINKDKKTFNFNEVYDTGTSFSMYVHEVIYDNLHKIRKNLEYALFLKDAEPLKKMIEKDKEGWERLYGKELGKWDDQEPKSV
jgi:hypothetical protein